MFFLKLTLFVIYTQGLFERLLGPEIGIYFVEVPLCLFLIINYNHLRTERKSSVIFSFLIFSVVVLMIFTFQIVEGVKYIRFVVYFYFFHRVLGNVVLNQSRYRHFVRFIVFIILIQGLAATYELFVLGERTERFVGLMSASGGTTATVFPLIIIQMCLIWWLNRKDKRVTDIFVLITLLFTAGIIAYASGKRAFYFYSIIILTTTTLLQLYYFSSSRKSIKRTITIVFIAIGFIPVFLVGIKNSNWLNRNISSEMNAFGVLVNAVEQAKNYETQDDVEGTITRSKTTKMVLNQTIKDFGSVVGGYGFNAYNNDRVKKSLNIRYGIVGITRDLISTGWLISFLIVYFFIHSLRYKQYRISVEKIILERSLVFLFLLVHFTYSSDFIVHLKISALVSLAYHLLPSLLTFNEVK